METWQQLNYFHCHLPKGQPMKNCNEQKFLKDVRKNRDGTWSVNVCFGKHYITDVRRYTYRTRRQARQANISDTIGKDGRI